MRAGFAVARIRMYGRSIMRMGIYATFTIEMVFAEEFFMKKARKTQVKAKKKSSGRSTRTSAPADHIHEGDEIDGCELDFTAMEATLDAALPASIGGVATIGRSRRKAASPRS